MDWVSFDEIKKTVTLQMVIDHYGIPFAMWGRTRSGASARCRRMDRKRAKRVSPRPSTKGSAAPGHASRNLASNRADASGGNVLDFVAAMEQCSIRDAAIKLQTWFLVPAAGKRASTVGKEHRAENSAGKEPEQKLVSEKNGRSRGE